MTTPSDPVERAQAAAQERRRKRQEIVTSLPDVRNPAATLHYGLNRPRKPPKGYSRKRQAEAIREWARAETIVNYGRSRINFLRQVAAESDPGNVGEQIRERLTKRQWRRFQSLMGELTDTTYQALGLHFRYAGGADLWELIKERILYPKNDANEGLDMLDVLVEQTIRAKRMYAPSVIGRIRI